MNYPHEIRAGLNENHRSMCKLGSTESSTYRFVVPTMQTVAQKITKRRVDSTIGRMRLTPLTFQQDILTANTTIHSQCRRINQRQDPCQRSRACDLSPCDS